ncbi:MAG: carboxypeptidase-like regulatory domain-containing protein, partial [Actinomycetes bacterium]
GGITASHDGSAIAGASVAVTDTHSLAYSASTDGSGRYARTLPAATYRMTASAYGYLPQTFTDLELGTGGRTQDFALQAAPPVAPPVTTSVVGTGVHLAWTHVPPNMTYTVHRALDPYFTPVLQNQQKSLAFTEQLVHDDLTGTGNRFYAVVGKNAAGVAAPPDRVGVFRYSLQPGD